MVIEVGQEKIIRIFKKYFHYRKWIDDDWNCDSFFNQSFIAYSGT